MDPATAATWLELLRSLGFGFTVAAVLFIWALFTRRIVFGWYVRAVERERDAWRDTALDGKNIVLKLVEREERRQ